MIPVSVKIITKSENRFHYDAMFKSTADAIMDAVKRFDVRSVSAKAKEANK